jgi:hypothetical protein
LGLVARLIRFALSLVSITLGVGCLLFRAQTTNYHDETAAQWQQVLAVNHLVEASLATRYDLVLHLVTAADGAAQHYTTANNLARTETPAEAVALDQRFQAAWGRHPSVERVVVDNSTDFAGKVKRSVEAVVACVEKAATAAAAAATADVPSDGFAAEAAASKHTQLDALPPPEEPAAGAAPGGGGKGKPRGSKLKLLLPGKGGKGGGKHGSGGCKASWPELVGQTGDAAVAAIKAAAPSLAVAKVPEGAMVTMDHRLDRVRVFVGADGKVARAPKLG